MSASPKYRDISVVAVGRTFACFLKLVEVLLSSSIATGDSESKKNILCIVQKMLAQTWHDFVGFRLGIEIL